MDWAKTTARRDEKHLCIGIGCVLYKIIDSNFFSILMFDISSYCYVAPVLILTIWFNFMHRDTMATDITWSLLVVPFTDIE